MKFEPSYMRCAGQASFKNVRPPPWDFLQECTLCPHNCRNNRLKNELARCHSGYLPIVSSSCMHFGEEPALAAWQEWESVLCQLHNAMCVLSDHQISPKLEAEQKNEVSVRVSRT